MKGDFTRNTFDAGKHYSAVLMQQGRVHLDADWNEQQAINLYRMETEARNVIGACGAPAENPGFQVTVKEGKRLVIGRGHFYVDGILCENERAVLYEEQPDFPDPPDVLGVLQEAGTDLGIVYLDVWRRHVTALDDPLIREKALSGPDTATRVKTVWQVKVLPVRGRPADTPAYRELQARHEALEARLEMLEEAGAEPTAIEEVKKELAELEQAINQVPPMASCQDAFPEWRDLFADPRRRLKARTEPPGEEKPCELPPTAGYQRLENQLYRVEVHKPGRRGVATFKWSRENGSVVTRIEKFDGSEITVHDVGPDDVLGFANGQWVEIVDDRTELHGQPGQLLQIANVDPATRIIRLKTASTAVDMKYNPRLRRWDQSGDKATVNGVRILTGWHTLESGIQVQFAQADYETGDYWLIPARTATGEIEWPPYEVPNTNPDQVPPLGIHHHYCRLAVVRLDDEALKVVQDCRIVFPPLASPALHVIGTNWDNDDLFDWRRLLQEGLAIRLDASPDPRTVNNSTMIVSVETPHSNASTVRIDQILILPGQIEVQANVIRWRWQVAGTRSGAPLMAAMPALRLDAVAPSQRTLRVRVTLKGHTIWGEFGKRRLYLDGQAFGRPGLRAGGQTQRTALVFPTGNAERASDFESWFFLGLPQAETKPLQVTSVNFIRATATGEQSSSAGVINVPPLPAEPVTFKAGERINVVEITFNRPVSDQGMNPNGEPQCIRVERMDASGNIGKVHGNLEIKEPAVVRFLALDPVLFEEGQYQLIAQGSPAEGGPAVMAADDGTALDGDFSGQPGGDFVLPFNAQ